MHLALAFQLGVPVHINSGASTALTHYTLLPQQPKSQDSIKQGAYHIRMAAPSRGGSFEDEFGDPRANQASR